MKKKSIAMILAAVLSVAMASCKSNQPADTANTDNTAAEYPVDKDGNILGTRQEGAVDEVSMRKVDGQTLTQTDNPDSDLSASGKVGGIKVSIKSAKLIDTADGQAVVVSFKFKNATSSPLSFDGLFTVEATGDGASFAPALVTGIEGVNINSSAELIASGSSATVQKAYAYNGESSIDVTVSIYGEPSGDRIGASFKITE